jgi:ABC-2 type transport system permease protein
MKNFFPLVQREWLQHRFGWALMALLPTALAVLLVSFGELDIDAEEAPGKLPVALALGALGGGIGLHLVIFGLTALIIVSGIARRDHADRSVEFWLSLPTGHAESLSVPLIVHLLLAPLAALGIGMLGGLLVSAVLVGRVAGFGEWFALPWPALLAGGVAIAVRLAAGLVLAVLWLSPLILATVLLTAWFRRWGLVILAVGIGLGSVILDRLFGQPILSDLLSQLIANAGRSLANTGGGSFVVEGVEDVPSALRMIPRWAVADAGAALRLLVSPLLVGALLVAGACFAALVQWRQRGAGDAG